MSAHGREWKNEYGKILKEFVGKGYLPIDVETAVRKSLHNPGATSCSDEELMRVLMRYDRKKRTTTWWNNSPSDNFSVPKTAGYSAVASRYASASAAKKLKASGCIFSALFMKWS